MEEISGSCRHTFALDFFQIDFDCYFGYTCQQFDQSLAKSKGEKQKK